MLVIWDMDAKRKENPQWQEGDNCSICSKPFFWNLKEMWKNKIVGKRQHHCRFCGAAICDECSKTRSPLPIFGHEFGVRICNNCTDKVTLDE